MATLPLRSSWRNNNGSSMGSSRPLTHSNGTFPRVLILCFCLTLNKGVSQQFSSMTGWQIWGVRWGRFQNRRSVLRKKFVEFETMSSRMSIWSVLPPRDAECDVFPFSSCMILVGVCPRNCNVDVTCVGEGNLLQLALGIGERRRLLLYPFSRIRCFANCLQNCAPK